MKSFAPNFAHDLFRTKRTVLKCCFMIIFTSLTQNDANLSKVSK